MSSYPLWLAGIILIGPSRPGETVEDRAVRVERDCGHREIGVHASYQWELSGPNGGDCWLIVNDGTYTIGRGKIHNPGVTFVASDEDWVVMSNKTLNVSFSIPDWPLKDSRQP